MGARAQTICYPTNGDTGNISDICQKCNAKAPHTKADCCTDSGAKNSQTEIDPCSVFCNSSSNTVCSSAQAYCNIGHELILSHGDVGPHPAIACSVKDQFIFRNWTAVYWNSLQDNLLTADRMGKTASSGFGFPMTPAAADPGNNTHVANSLVTAAKFNEIAVAYRDFRGSLANVNVGDVIKGAEHAGQIVSQYSGLKFKSTVCDCCNVAMQKDPSCNQNCACSCSCNCGCACPCSCECACPCPCSCDCSCSCACDCACSCTIG